MKITKDSKLQNAFYWTEWKYISMRYFEWNIENIIRNSTRRQFRVIPEIEMGKSEWMWIKKELCDIMLP